MQLPTDYLSPALLRCSHYDGYAANQNTPYSVRTVYDYEVEYEYLRPHDGLKAFQELLDQIGAKYEGNCRSKVMRAVGTPWLNQ